MGPRQPLPSPRAQRHHLWPPPETRRATQGKRSPAAGLHAGRRSGTRAFVNPAAFPLTTPGGILAVAASEVHTVNSTVRLFWDDPYRTQFRATLLASSTWEGHPAALLDATCFYPTSGGQPHDTGTLDGIAVIDVAEQDGLILHVLERPLEAAPGSVIDGAVDWVRRFDHMQQHSGQHLLSAVFASTLSAATVSFHLGADACTIDLDRDALADRDAARVEDAANAIVTADLPVTAREYDEAAALALPLRKAPAVRGLVRVVTVQAADGHFLDASPCGGTHVASTGSVGPIHIRRVERRRDGVRVEFLCGQRAIADYRSRDTLLQSLAAGLSVGVADLPAALSRLQESDRAARQALESARKELLAIRITALAEGAEPLPGGQRLVCRVLDGCDAATLRAAANALISGSGTIALLAIEGPSPQVIFARSADVDLRVDALLREVLASYGGKGGGAPHMAQGGGMPADALPALLAAARRRILAG